MFSIIQNLLNVTKKFVFLQLNSQLKNIITNFLDNLLFCFDENKYIKTMLQFEKDVYNLLSHSIKYIVETLDNQFKKSEERISKRNVNKSNVTRTITTIYGDITFNRTYYESKNKEEKNKHHYIMSKCFVAFTGIKQKGKRKELIGKHIFITDSKTPWLEFINEISTIYDFEQIEKINFLNDAGNWL